MNSYKICFLGYPGLTEMAKKTIEDMKLSDTEFMLRDCTPGTLREVLGEAVSNGFEVFVGGGSNYAKFKQISTLYIQELQVTEIDYLVALKKQNYADTILPSFCINTVNPSTFPCYHSYWERMSDYWYMRIYWNCVI